MTKYTKLWTRYFSWKYHSIFNYLLPKYYFFWLVYFSCSSCVIQGSKNYLCFLVLIKSWCIQDWLSATLWVLQRKSNKISTVDLCLFCLFSFPVSMETSRALVIAEKCRLSCYGNDTIAMVISLGSWTLSKWNKKEKKKSSGWPAVVWIVVMATYCAVLVSMCLLTEYLFSF